MSTIGRMEFNSAADIPAGSWRWKHIDPAHEWACKGTGKIIIVPDFLDRIEELRTRVGFALPITSGYRSPEYNARVSDTSSNGPHTTGMACDIAVTGIKAMTLISTALQLGFVGIGVNQKGTGRFVHLDMARTVPAIWSY